MAMPAPQTTTPLTALEAVVLDTETTGLDATTDRLVQIGALVVRGGALREEERFETLVNPGVSIPPSSTAIHGIHDEDVAAAPAPGPALSELLAFLAERPVIGYAIAFDLEVLARAAEAEGAEWAPPTALDVRPLARLVAPSLADHGLDALCAWAGIENRRRHSAIGDAAATAELFLHLIPLLRERDIRTLADAEAACLTVEHRDAKRRGEVAGAAPRPSPDKAARALPHLDTYAFSTTVAEAMSAPPVVVSGARTVGETLDLLMEKGISSVFVEDSGDGTLGIVTERDLLRALAAERAAAFDTRLDGLKSMPLQCVRAEDPIYRAIGRLDRMNIRHLAVRDRAGTLVGAVTMRNLLRHRIGAAMALGDEIEAAADEVDLGLAWSKVPAVARSLLEQDVRVDFISSVISSEIRSLTKRAAMMGEARLEAEDRGPAPHPYALLVLGSAGRGESLISADQDNALVIDAETLTPDADAWFADLGAHIADILDGVGIVYCKGGVMAKNATWRRTSRAWRALIDDWVTRQSPEDLLNVDIFFDAITVHGEERLGREIWEYGFEAGGRSRSFLRALEGTLAGWQPPLGLFGGFRTGTDERVDLKLGGLFPIVSAARILSIKTGRPEHGTAARYLAAAAADAISDSIAKSLAKAQQTVLSAILAQQLKDAQEGRRPGSKVDPKLLDKPARAELREAVRRASDAIQLVREGMI